MTVYFEDISIGDSAEAWAKSVGKILAGKEKAHTLVLDFSEIRAAGSGARAAAFAGMPVGWITVKVALLSGALAGLVGMNEIAGVSGKLILEFVSGAGFTGIAVALMGRNHPVGIVFASILFGALFQGGAEVAFDVPGFSRDMVVMLQGFIVLFSGAMVYVIAPRLAWALSKLPQRKNPAGATHG